MMDAATSGGSPFGDSLGVVVANFAGVGNNPGFEAAKKEALREGSDAADISMGGAAKFDFFDSDFDLIGSCGINSRRDFFGALQIGLGVGPCQNMLLLEAGESLCPSALLMLYYALQKATDYDPTWSSLRVGKGRHGYGGLVIKCSAAAELLKNPGAIGGGAASSSKSSHREDDDEDNLLHDLSSWMRKERERTVLALLPGRPLGGAFSYRYRLISENLIGAGCGSAIDLGGRNIDLSFYGDAKCVENDVSPCAASENDAWLEYKPPNIAAVIGSHITLVIGRPGQSCNDACGKRQTTCLSGSQVKYNLNDCSTLRGRFPCPGGCVSLTAGAGSELPVPSQLVTTTQINGVSVYKGTCIIRQNGRMSMCRATSK
jgi:hypothetical protein